MAGWVVKWEEKKYDSGGNVWTQYTTPFLLRRLPLLTKMMDCYRPSCLGNLIPVPTCNSLDGQVVLG